MSSDPLYIHPTEARRRFEEYCRGEIREANLAEGALLVALEEHPRLDVDEYLDRLEALADNVRRRMGSGEPEIFRLGHLHHELFDEAKFNGNAQNYYDVRNSFLNEVIDRKVGLPITLATVFIDVARRVGSMRRASDSPGTTSSACSSPSAKSSSTPSTAAGRSRSERSTRCSPK